MTHFSAPEPLDLPLVSIEDTGLTILRRAMTEEFAGRFAVVSAFGADSALLLALAAEINPGVPVLFLETGMHFQQTLDHRDALVARLGLTDVRSIRPDPAAVAGRDPRGDLHLFVPDDCCALRKVAPLERALAPFAAWATGRRRHQTATRTALPFVERSGGRTKINPLADWSAERVAAEIARRNLPRHPLVAEGFVSIGCAPCTRAVRPGEDARAGRWAGLAKVECGIHGPAFTGGAAFA
ncbi:MAG: phosphoadenylyl-sulfate reductase [Alphaproteobacteria bacterium]|nr:phosphoadenylyl-sulfate reductase [Alphaproteobacteria bacterium]